MLHINDQQVAALLVYNELADALAEAFRAGGMPPPRQHVEVGAGLVPQGHLLLMPAWQSGQKMGVKLVTIFPANAERNIPTVNATYLLMDATTGVAEMILDATELTRRRTAAASVLAARYLAREKASKLLMVGTGAMSTHLIRAHCSSRPIESVQVWGRRYQRACSIVEQLSDLQLDLQPVEDLEAAVSGADIISCATMASTALVHGDWLKPGQHLDLVGSFTPAMREVDDTAMRRAKIFVDTRAGALSEAGELVQAIGNGVINETDIKGDLFDLAGGACRGRQTDEDITLFKSVGSSLEDLVAAELVATRYTLESR
jgi:ornithine cyclodeaminase